jgi:uncharacterized repeat protein (TIGR02543 family)
MIFPVRRTSTAIAALATAGVASLFLGAAPASAASAQCGAGGTLISGNICEQTFTSGSATFTPTAQMSQLEVLLVAGGGTGGDSTTGNGYAVGGGGGQVTLVGFGAATSAPLTLTVGGPGLPSTISDGTTTTTAAPGTPANTNGGTSGTGKAGVAGSSATPYGAGGGAGASPVGSFTGGAGIVVSSIAAAGSVFSTDANCYGGGGAVGISGTAGTATCGGGQPTDATSASLIAPTANSGGGGGGISGVAALSQRQGASGLVVVRWIPPVTLSFIANGHGAAAAAETFVSGTAPVKPADPTASGWVFNGWFSNAALTVRADFTAPITASTTFYASWSPAPVTLSFIANGHGAAVSPETLASGTAPVKPADPTASGWVFNGWFSNAALTLRADFTAPITASTTFYASWSPALAATGGAPNGAELPIGIAALALGVGLFAVGYRRKRKSH